MCVSVTGRVSAVDNGRVLVRFGEEEKWVLAGMRPHVQPGDCVVVQAGLILDVISEEEALELDQFALALDELFSDSVMRPKEDRTRTGGSTAG